MTNDDPAARTRSALVVQVDEVEVAVADLRDDLDPSARLGVPAHVTVLFPFMAAHDIDSAVLTRLTRRFASQPAFESTFVRVFWFGDEVLWLAAQDDEPFKLLTEAVWEEFPRFPPYGGQHEAVVPHVTIADHGPREAMLAAERSVQAFLPITASIRAVTLLVEQSTGEWQAAQLFPLAAGPVRAGGTG